jgi:ankyrin repeat protein
MTRILILGVLFSASALPASAQEQVAGSGRASVESVSAVSYDQQVRPILASRCFGCHGPRQQQSGLRLDLRQNALRGGDYGVVIVPGHAADSKLIQRLVGSDAGLQMPPTGALPPEEIAILRAWIDQGADMPGRAAEAAVVERTTEPHVQAFLDAIAAHDLAAVRRALAADTTLARAADGFGSTALMHGAYAGTLAIMEALVEAGADVNARNARKASALHWAVADPAKMKLLLLTGADVNARTTEGRTALHLAALQPMGAPLVKLLLEVGAEVDARSILGATPLFAAAAVSVESTRLLLEKGADPNIPSQTGGTALMAARSSEIVALLVARGADVNARSKRGETALAAAAGRGDLMSVNLLLDQGADVNATDYRGYTPLMHAAQYDRDAPELIRLLLASGANVAATGEGRTALTIAARRGETELTRILREAVAATRSGGSQD